MRGKIYMCGILSVGYVKNKISLEQAKAQLEEKNIEILNRTIMQMKMRNM